MSSLETLAVPEAYRPDVERAIEILKAGGCSEVYLFGSLATGELRDGSDIDLAVRGCPKSEFFPLLGRLLMELEHPVDLIDLDSHDPFPQYLERKGRLRRVG